MAVIELMSSADEAKEKGMVWASRDDTLNLITGIFHEWEPPHQARAIVQAKDIAMVGASIPGLVWALKLRKQLRMDLFKVKQLPVPLSILVPGAVAGMLHHWYVTDDIIMQETACPVCVETRAISIQVGLGSFLPAASALYGSMLVGMYNQAPWAPRNFSGFFNFTKNMVSKNTTLLLGVSAFQMLLAGGLVRWQVNCFEDVMKELNRRYEEDHPESKEYEELK